MSHTKEPWMSWRDGNGCLLVGPSTNYTVAQCFHMPEVDSCEANARRIVACVNACGEMTTEEIENDIAVGGYSSIVKCHQAHIEEVEKQRDELLAALEHHQDQTRPIQLTIEAIAKVKGGAA